MIFDTITLQCFIAVAETGSFTRAAERVGRTQSAISQQMTKLAALLGKPLFVKGRQFGLTPEGEIFLGYARQIFALHREALDRFTTPELEGEVRFGLPENFASVYLSEVLADFSRIHPRILLNIECDLTLNLFDRFKKKKFDLVLVKMNRPEDFPNGLDVWSEPLKWVGDPILINRKKPVPLVLSPAPCVYRASAIKALEKAGRPWRLVFSSPSYAGTVAAVKAGMGISVMPHTMIPPELQAVDASLLPKLADTHVSLLKHRADNPAINTLEEFVLKRLKH
ncbi:LysR substrate-binding domain-containing protein [Prosthecobacter vanneervenii]|uniref:DNA-binding transcriptional LysR family regulator n=1 Tax=Prosthecobacter vanneervenii TaxID=48466 RepID=A0A7W8DJR2_9BACT|nr:LysR substrate-binding domain-containing protein [Prosthecobacter vanneervenii]MBB5032404.1 DNA-binding transcriptional LysR family regulator [Prosthecobacter vanneervenii]